MGLKTFYQILGDVNGLGKTHKMRDVEKVLVIYYSIKEIQSELNKE